MHGFHTNDYLNSLAGLLAQHRRRSRRRLHFRIDGVEPRAKHSMSEAEKDEVQRQLIKCLVRLNRNAFRGPIALKLTLGTTEKTPTHSHNIAKNLLDLFGAARLSVATRRRSLLYADDQQIHALAVSCRHGEAVPTIWGVASPLWSLLEDLDLAMRSRRERDDDREHPRQFDRFGDAVEEVNELLRTELDFRRRFGDRAFESCLRYSRQEAQEHLLGRAAVTPMDLAQLFNVSGRKWGIDSARMWETIFASTPLRIHLSELPRATGASALWKQEIDAKLLAFQAQFRQLINPLLVPVALEVVIRPPPPSRLGGLHDLDNVLRTYLIPRVVELLKPVSHYFFALDEEGKKRFAQPVLKEHPDLVPSIPPASTKSGITRYEAWRLPPAPEGSAGFVSVAIVSDQFGNGDVFRQIEEEIDEWEESLERRL